ncbi:MAG: CvpA family protein [Wolbachia endosymbiont of Menacanthus eurysternus]|nr:MAG: CvpA family protein [Wolbachia endosymbiont of Menacanthus eurysternus]
MIFDYIIVFIVIIFVIISISRGFIKELCALIFLSLSIFFTFNHYDFFAINYSKYFDYKITQNVFSTISVFIVLNLIFMIINNFLMYMLLPIRLNLIDRTTGILIGAFKGILLSYILFFAVHLYCYTIYDKRNEEFEKIEDLSATLPTWITNSYSYQVFLSIENIINMYIPDSLILKIEEISKKVIQSKKANN